MTAYVVSSGQTSSGLTLNSGDALTVLAGGTAVGTTISSGGSLAVSSGGTASGTSIDFGGSETVSAGGGDFDGTVSGNGTQDVFGSASGTRVTVVSSGGSTYVGLQIIEAGGTVQDAQLLGGGVQFVTGTASGTIVSGAGSAGFVISEQFVLSGGIVVGTTLEDQGRMELDDGSASGTIISSGGLLFHGAGTNVTSGTTILNGGQEQVTGDSDTESGAVVSSGGVLKVANGGSAVSTTIDSGGSMTVSLLGIAGGSVTSTNVNNGGLLTLSSAGRASATTISSGGSETVSAGGSTSSDTISAGGSLTVSSGGGTTSTRILGSEIVLSGGTAMGAVILSGGSETVSSGGATSLTTLIFGGTLTLNGGANNTGFTWSGGTIQVASGYSLTSQTVGLLQELDVQAGGAVSATNLTAAGVEIISAGGSAISDTIGNVGQETVLSGGSATSALILSGGSLTISTGGTAIATTLDGGFLSLSSGGTAVSTTLDGGSLTVSSGGSASATVVNGGTLIMSGGANNTGFTWSSGTVQIGSGFTLTSQTVGASQTLEVGGLASDVTLNNGGLEVVSGFAFASKTTINSGGVLDLSGLATSTTVNSGGSLVVGGFPFFRNFIHGSAVSTTINAGGSVIVDSGGILQSSTISSGGLLTVSSGGEADNTAISGSGLLDLLNGALVVSGGVTFSGSGGELDLANAGDSFVISGFSTGDTIDLTSVGFDSAGFAVLTSGNVLEVTEGGTTYDLNLDLGQFFSGEYFHLAGDGKSGTRITANTTPPPQTRLVLNDFSWAQGWGSADDPRIVTDVNGDGNSDYVGFGYQYTFISYGGTFSSGGSTGPGFTSATASVKDFGTSEGYTADVQRGAAAAGVGAGDILYGQGYAGVFWYEATGETATTDAAGNTYNVLQYQTSPNLYGNFGSQEGWTSDNGFQILKTSSADASASILGFGYSGIVVGPDAFATGATAASSYVIPIDVGNSSGWKQSVDIRTFTDQNGKAIDLNGDGVADFVGMGPDGLVYAYGSESGGSYTLGALQTAHIDGGNTDLGEAQGWTDATTVRDIVYDSKTGYDDIIAFGAAGVYVAMGQDPTTHNGEPFGQLYLAMADFGSNQGWTVSDTPRLIGDVTGDGIPDIVGFGYSDTYVAVGSYDSSGNLVFKVDTSKTIADFGSAEGWSGSTEQTVRALGTVAASGSISSHSDLILSGAYNTQIVPLTSGSDTGSTTSAASIATASAALPAFTTASIDPTVAIAGSAVEGTTLTASAVVTGGFSGTTEFRWQRFYAGSWWNIPVELSPYSAGEVFTYVASPSYVVREEDENVSAIRVEADFVDNSGLTVAVVDSPSVGPVLDEPASLSLSAISGSAVPGTTLSVSAEVVTDEGTFTPLIHWQRFYSGGWWDIPVELSPYTSGEAFTFVTTPTYVVRAEDANVLAIRAEAIYVDDTGQTLTAFSGTGTSGGALTISRPPELTASGVTLGEDRASIALAITIAAHDSDYTLGGVTIGGVPAGWSLSGDGAASIAAGTWTAGSGGLGGLTLVAPSALEAESFTLSVTASESAVGPTGVLTATATTSFAVSVAAVAEAPVFSGAAMWSGTDEAGFALPGITVAAADGDDALGTEATLSGLSSGWTLYDGSVALAASGGVASLALSDLGALRIAAPDGSGPATDSLTLTVAASEGGATASASEVLVVAVSAVAEAPVFSGAAMWSGTDEAGFALPGITVAAADGDDALGTEATLSGLSSGWTLYDGSVALAASGGVASLALSDLGALRIAAPDGSGPATDSLTLTVAASEGGATASASEVLVVAVSAVAEAPVFSGAAMWSGTDEAGFALPGITVAAADGDDALGTEATLSGLSSGWTLYDGSVALAASGGVASLALSDLGALRIAAPDGSGPATDSLTLTVAASEGGATASASEVLVVAVSAVAEAPVFSGAAMWSGTDEAGFALPGITVAAADGDDALGTEATLSGLSSGWTLYDGSVALAASGGVASLALSDLGALRIAAPDGSGPATDSLTLTVAASEGGATASASEVLVVAVSAVAEAPVFSGAAMWSGTDEAGFALPGITVAAADGDDALGTEATLSGLSSGWTLYDGSVALAASGGVASLALSDLGALRIAAPDGSGPATDSLTLTVAASEGGATASASEVLVVAVSAVAEAPVFSGAAMWSGTDEAGFALPGITVAAADGDDALGTEATLSGLSSGWTLYDGSVALAASGGVASLALSDLGALRIAAPDGSGPATDSLTLTVAASEGGATASASEVLVVAVSAVAEAPVFSGAAMWSGTDEAGFALPGITVAAADGDDALGTEATLSGLSSGWTLYDGSVALAASGGVASLALSDLGALRIAAPDGSGPATDSLTLTVAASEGGATASASEVLVVAVSAVAEAPVFSGAAMWSGTDEAGFALPGITVAAADGDDALGTEATLSGLSSGWTLYDGSVALAASGGVASLALSDLGALRIAAPDGSGPATDSLTLTVAASEGGATASASEVLVVAVSAVAEAPVFSGAAMWSGTDEAGFALPGITVAAADGDDALGTEATLSGLSSGWTLYDGSVALAASGGVASLALSDLGALRIAAPDGSGPATDSLTLTVAASEGGATASASEVLVVAVSAVAEAPVFSGAAMWSGTDEAGFALPGITVAAADGDDALGTEATLSGLSSGWTLYDGSVALAASGGVASLALSDLGALRIAAPDGSGPATDSLTLTVAASEGGATASASEVLVVAVSAVAEAPVFSGAAMWSGTDEAGFALPGITVAAADGDDALGTEATLSGLSSGWTLYDGSVALAASGGVASLALSDLGALRIAAPDGSGPATDSLTLTVAASEGGATASASEVLVVAVSAVAEAPVFSGAAMWSGTDEAGFALPGITVAAADGDDALGTEATLSGLSSGWTLYDGSVALAASGGVASLALSDLGALRIAAPDGSGPATDSLTLTVAASEGGATASASEVLVVAVSAVAEAPVFSGAAMWSGTDEAGFALPGITVAAADGDDALGTEATLSGLSSGWTLYDGSVALAASGGVASLALSDLGALRIAAPDGSGPATDSLTLTVAASEGGATASASEVLVVAVSAVAEAPVFSGPTNFSGGASVALSGLSVTASDPDDALSATITGLSSGWTLVDTHSTLSFTGTSITAIPVSDLGSLVVVAPSSATDLLTLTVSSSEGGSTTNASEILAVTAATGAVPPSFSGTTTFYGGVSVTLSNLGASAVGGDTLGTNATFTGLSSGWTLVDTHAASSFTGTSITAIPVSDLGSLVVVAPSGTTSGSDVLILTVSSSLGASTTSGSESLTLVAQHYTSLSGNLTGANLTGADLTGANLAGVTLTGATLTNATLTGAELHNATLTGATLTGADLSGADLHNAVLSNAGAGVADFSGADLHNANLTQVDLTGANLSGADLHNSTLTSATLTGADLSAANLNAANLTGTTLPLQLSSLGASASGHDVTGGVLDGFTGAVTISAVDNATTLGTRTISYAPANQPETWSIGNVSFAQGDTITVTATDSEGAFYSVSGTVVAAAPAGVAGSPINLALSDPAGGGPIAVTIAGIPEGWSLSAGTELANGAWTVATSDPSALSITPSGSFAGAAVVSVSESWTNPDGSGASAFVTDNVEAYAPGNPIFALSGEDNLTGSGANDLFVFAQPIANDRIYDFQPASSRIDLVGFPGISSFADLQGKIANDTDGNAVLTLGSGETIAILGVDAASLGAGNFLFNSEPVTGNAGNMTIGDGATLPLGGTVDNSGTIALNSAGGETDLVVLSGGLELQGGGAVALSDNAGNAILGSGVDTTLSNLDNTISGAGRLGDAAMTLNNAGVIDATGVNPLIIDTGSNSILNSGTLEATGAGGLVIEGAVANSGTLSADGGNLTIDGAVTGAGIAVIAGTATLEFGAASAGNTSFAPGAAGTIRLDRSAGFTGVVAGFAAGDAIDLTDLAFASNMTLGYTDNGAGGGVVTVGNAVQVVDLALLGQYAAAGFHAQSDPGGGTLITYTLQTSATDPMSLTNPSH